MLMSGSPLDSLQLLKAIGIKRYKLTIISKAVDNESISIN